MQQQTQAKNNIFTLAFNLLISIFNYAFSLSTLLKSLKIASIIIFIFWGMGRSYHKKHLWAPCFCIHYHFIVTIQPIFQQILNLAHTKNYPIISASMKPSWWACLHTCNHNSTLFKTVASHNFVSVVVFLISFINQASSFWTIWANDDDV